MKNILSIFLFPAIIFISYVLTCQNPEEPEDPDIAVGDQLFIYQGDYNSLGTIDEIAQLVALHDYAVFTHGFYLDGSLWENGSCLDVNYSNMPELLTKVRELNPDIMIFGYVPATADHPNGCWPQPSIQMAQCPDGDCSDFRTWTNLWLNLETEHNAITIDGIFIDLVHPALIGAAVRDSVFSYVKSCGKFIMANALSDTIGLKFTVASPILQSEDYVLVEGYYRIAGYVNTQTDAMNQILREIDCHWAALVSENYNTIVTCNSNNMTEAYKLFKQYEGSAFAYQSADLGTQTGKWIFCSNSQD